MIGSDNKKTGALPCRITLKLAPMSLCLLATALVFQDAYALREEMAVEDEIASSLIHWIHPVSSISLLLAYGISVFILFCRIEDGDKTNRKDPG